MQSQCSGAKWNAIAMPKHRAVFAKALYSDDNRDPRSGRRARPVSDWWSGGSSAPRMHRPGLALPT
jgi:hypothetical protein